MEEDILNYLYQLSCFVGHPVYTFSESTLIIEESILSIHSGPTFNLLLGLSFRRRFNTLSSLWVFWVLPIGPVNPTDPPWMAARGPNIPKYLALQASSSFDSR